MNGQRRWSIISIALLWIYLTGILAGCRPATPTPTPTPTPPPTGLLPQFPEKPAAIKPTDYFVPNQVIVRGQKAQVEALLGSRESAPIAEISLSYAGLPLPVTVVSDTKNAEWVIRLYTLPESASVTETVMAITAEARDKQWDLAIEPNYVTGEPILAPYDPRLDMNQLLNADQIWPTPQLIRDLPADQSVAGGGVTADPWSITSSPWSITSSPAPGSPTTAERFWPQWAFGPQGISLFTDQASATCNVDLQGAGIRVGVFDTSPFDGSGNFSVNTAGWLTPTLTLAVSHPFPLPNLSPAAPYGDSHGLFVAGLIHGVAPQSEIHLVRVLNQQGQGDLFSLLAAMEEFARPTLLKERTLSQTVFNLSLGINAPARLLTFEWLLAVLHGYGGIIVAAAGNDSTASNSLPAQYPASSPNTLGVAAGNIAGEQACFSNQGAVRAPGGDGDRNCQPMQQKDCQDGVTSLLWDSANAQMQLGCWAGTSFATPLVSGVAALIRGSSSGSSDVYSEIQGRFTSNGNVNVAQGLSCILRANSAAP